MAAANLLAAISQKICQFFQNCWRVRPQHVLSGNHIEKHFISQNNTGMEQIVKNQDSKT